MDTEAAPTTKEATEVVAQRLRHLAEVLVSEEPPTVKSASDQLNGFAQALDQLAWRMGDTQEAKPMISEVLDILHGGGSAAMKVERASRVLHRV